MASTSGLTVSLIAKSTLVSQGAEAKIYKAFLTSRHPSLEGIDQDHETPVLIKYRFSKGYRHKTLDTTLTKARVAGEARSLIRCLRAGVNAPAVKMVDATEGVLGIEWIEGKSVRKLLPGGEEEEEEEASLDSQGDELMEEGDIILLKDFEISVDQLMKKIGTEIAKMHLADVIHGDLTTSNMMLRRSDSELILIDFGLSYQSTLVEDKAVDLYVLERAFASTHPDSEPMFQSVLNVYQERMGKEWNAIKRRLNDDCEDVNEVWWAET